MSLRVVEVLEVVEVEHQHRAGRAVALHARRVELQLPLEAAAVEQAGQRIVVGEVLQLALVAATLGDVLGLGDEMERFTYVSRISVRLIAAHTAWPDAWM